MTTKGREARMRRSAGFTLIEMLVVLTVMTLILAIILPRLTGAQERAALQSATRSIASGLRSTRSLAMTKGHEETFVVNTTSGVFRAGSTAKLARVPSGIHLLLLTVTQDIVSDQEGSIRFFADGSSTGGGVVLSAGDLRGQVLVDWLTGRVSIENASHAPQG